MLPLILGNSIHCDYTIVTSKKSLLHEVLNCEINFQDFISELPFACATVVLDARPQNNYEYFFKASIKEKCDW